MNASNTAHRRHRFIFIATIVSIPVYLLSSMGWYVAPDNIWIFSVASLGFAFIWPWLLALSLWWWWSFGKPPIFLWLLLLMGWGPATATYSIGRPKPFEAKKETGALRVMQWNCMGLPGMVKGWYEHTSERSAAVDLLNRYKPDVICLQDFNDTRGRQLYSNIDLLTDSLGYPYRVFASHPPTIHPYGKVWQGTAIFSRLPFLQQGVVPYEGFEYAGSIVWADMDMDGKMVRVVTTHFRSMQLFSHRTFAGKKLPYFMLPDSAIIMSSSILKKLRFFQMEHARQATQFRAFLDTCSVPVIVAADLNTVPANYIYRQVRGGDLQDGFLGSKTGLGNTYNYLAPHLRIDYLMHHDALEAVQWHHFEEGFFDHDHLMADHRWKKEKTK
ncbi:MAG TPA: endonuclease/exonuclease/phosphatase family protein [Phnomibacter sp.]|nr:endonuclease/exonuclease/phosphatase family protein [Phnomibacter sp.]